MKWYILTLILIAYPIAELSRLIWVYWTLMHDVAVLWELGLMWLAFFGGMVLIALKSK